MFGLNYAPYMLWEERNMLKKLKAECENQNRWRDAESILKVVNISQTYKLTIIFRGKMAQGRE